MYCSAFQAIGHSGTTTMRKMRVNADRTSVNASSFGVRRYFMDENALAFNVDISGAPGTHWPEQRVGPIRPRLEWKIEKLD